MSFEVKLGHDMPPERRKKKYRLKGEEQQKRFSLQSSPPTALMRTLSPNPFLPERTLLQKRPVGSKAHSCSNK